MDGGGEGGKEGGTFLLLLKPKSDGWMDGWKDGGGGRGDERSGGELRENYGRLWRPGEKELIE